MAAAAPADRPVRLRALWLENPRARRGARFYPLALLEQKADTLLTVGRWAAGERILRRNLVWLRGAGLGRQLAPACNQLGGMLYEKGNYREALALFREAAAIYRRGRDRLGRAQCLSNLAGIYHNQGHYAKARGHLERALALARAARDLQKISQYTGNLGIIDYQMGEFAQAARRYRRTLDLAERLQLDHLVMAAVGNLALVYQEQGDYRRALEFNQRYLALARAQGNAQVTSYAIGNLGSVYYDLDRYPEALAAFEEHHRITQEIGDKPGRILAADNLGSLYQSWGRPELASRYFRESLGLALELGNCEDASRAETHLGNLHRDRGEHAKALAHYRRGLRRLRGSDSDYYACYNLYQQAELFHRMGRAAQARRANDRARGIAQRLKTREIMVLTAVLRARLMPQARHAAAVAALRGTLPRARSGRQRAAVHFELAMMTRSPRAVEKARNLLAELFDRSRNIDYRQKLSMLDDL
jgi:tetratricopeptide (TPR) repeat protein